MGEPLKQQGITSLRASDLIEMSQTNGRKMKMPVFVLINYVKSCTDDLMSSVSTMVYDFVTSAQLAAGLATKANTSHTHVSADITDFATSVDGRVNTKITALINGAPAALDTLKELADQLATDESAVAALVTTVAGKANAVHTHVIGDVTGLQTALDGKAALYNAGTLVANAKFLTRSVTLTAAGTATIYLTDNGLIGGNALFPTAVLGMQPVVNDATTIYPVSRVISNGNKTCVLTVNKAATPLLSLLGLNILAAPTAAPIGATVELLFIGY